MNSREKANNHFSWITTAVEPWMSSSVELQRKRACFWLLGEI
jgi:hypothetical protein